jgi:hypothetical protein
VGACGVGGMLSFKLSMRKADNGMGQNLKGRLVTFSWRILYPASEAKLTH